VWQDTREEDRLAMYAKGVFVSLREFQGGKVWSLVKVYDPGSTPGDTRVES